MILTCEICPDSKTTILDGHRWTNREMKNFENKHCIDMTIHIDIDQAGKPKIFMPSGMKTGSFWNWLMKQGMHMPSCLTGYDLDEDGTIFNWIKIPRGGKLRWREIATRLQAEGITTMISIETRTDPDEGECTHSCKKAKIDHAYCQCSCGGDNHASGEIGDWIKNFYCTISKIRISPEILKTEIQMRGISLQNANRSLHDAMNR